VGADRGEEIVDRPDPRRLAIQVRRARCEAEEVQVRIDQTGEHRRAAAVEPLGGGTREGPHVRRRPERQHTSAADGERARDRAVRVEGQDAGVLQQPVGARQSEDGRGLASLTFISWPQHVTLPLPGLLHRISVPQVSHRYRLPSCVAMRLR
jgi:hypothetical protein